MIALFLSPTWRGFGISLLTFIVYLFTMMPDLGFTDSGELAAAAHVLGIAHPTGYPLYTIIAHVWSLISPFSTVYDLNLLAGIFTALSVGIFSLILNEILEIFFESNEARRNVILSASMVISDWIIIHESWNDNSTCASNDSRVFRELETRSILFFKGFISWPSSSNSMVFTWTMRVGISSSS
jgi:hypothetical protein